MRFCTRTDVKNKSSVFVYRYAWQSYIYVKSKYPVCADRCRSPFNLHDTSGRARLRRRSLAHALNQNAFHIPRAATVSRESLVRPARVHRRRRPTIEGTLLLRRGPVRHTPPPCRRRRPDRSGHAARRSRTARHAPGRIPNTAAPCP